MTRILILAVVAATALSGCGVGGGGSEPGEIPFGTGEWKTDFSRHSAPLDEFVGGGPPKDGIPSIDEPKFVSVEEADRFLAPREPVAVIELDGTARAYPIQILVWHEIVNDEVAGRPIAVTYCPLCNSTVAFDRRVDRRVLDFGTTGMLRNSDLVMYDRQTESWWQQITADAVVGELLGTELEVIPSQILSWEQFLRLYPRGEVLSRDTGFSRSYGRSPYAAYDSNPESEPFLFEGEPDRSLPAKERVAAIETGEGSAVVYPFSRLRGEAPINDVLSDRSIVVLFDPEVASALDSSTISAGRDVGAAAVFDRTVKGRILTFKPGPDSGRFRDLETRSSWDLSGRAVKGPLQGEQLERIPHDDQFWFALAAFFDRPEIRE
ncbi:MAG: DUF3179 domain-containing protein [Solirubrobacterales bacterium]